MPALEDHDLRETALVWPAIADDAFGQKKMGPREEINVRWLDKQTEMLDTHNNSIIVDGTVIVEQERLVPIGSLLWYGTEDEWSLGTGSMETSDGNPQLVEVKAANNTPDLKARNYRRTLGFLRYKGALPT